MGCEFPSHRLSGPFKRYFESSSPVLRIVATQGARWPASDPSPPPRQKVPAGRMRGRPACPAPKVPSWQHPSGRARFRPSRYCVSINLKPYVWGRSGPQSLSFQHASPEQQSPGPGTSSPKGFKRVAGGSAQRYPRNKVARSARTPVGVPEGPAQRVLHGHVPPSSGRWPPSVRFPS